MSCHFKFIALAILPLVIVSCANSKIEENETYDEKITNVEFYQVKQVRFEENIVLPIVIAPDKEVNLGVTNGGRVTQILTEKGNKVTDGQLLLETDDEILRAALDNAKATYEWQKKEFERFEQLYKEENISEADFDAVQHALIQSESANRIAQKNFEDASLEAPFSGIVTMRNVEVGDILSPGIPAFRIINIDKVKVQAGIPEKYIEDFETGDPVKISIDAIPDRVFEGKINYISPEASPSVRTFLAEITIANRDGALRVGTMGNARIVRNVYENALMVPINAITETQDGHKVFVLKDGDIVEERSLNVLGGNELMVQVEGISEGEKIITKGNYDLIDGEKVNVTGEYVYVSGEEGS
ncbi:efflux RND transporter periplasmic adaptor subunit [Candidatus Latescibacterota bacterium]